MIVGDVRRQRAGEPISARSLRDLAKMADRSVPRGPGVMTTPGGSFMPDQWRDWTPFFITYASPDNNLYSGVEAALDHVPIGAGATPFASVLTGGRIVDSQVGGSNPNAIRSLRPDTTFEVDELVMCRPSRTRPGDWEAVGFLPSALKRIMLREFYCGSDGEGYYRNVCIEAVGLRIVPCEGSSSSSGSGSGGP